jgi:cytochrome c oxidase assembly protein subunit 15
MNSARQKLRLVTRTAFALCFLVVVLGAYVRLSAAGLGCPDWPGCYGHLTPDGALAHAADATARFGGQIEVGKAWREMIHRYAAATLGILIVVIAAMAIQYRRERWIAPGFAVGLVGLVVAQGMLGMLTVTWQLKPLIVTSHLLLGLTTLSLLWWLVLTLARGAARPGAVPAAASPARPDARRWWASLALLALVAQIALGGWTSSNYAATACPDFPRCQNAWWPQADFADAFVVWRGLGINYEGGVLDHPARIAIHLAHRLGALGLTLLLLGASYKVLRNGSSAVQRRAAMAVAGMMLLQPVIGISMVMEGFPLWLATAHNAGAALLLLAVVALNHSLWVAERQ